MACVGCRGKRRVSKSLDIPVYDESGKRITESYKKHLERDARIKKNILISQLKASPNNPTGIILNRDIKNIQYLRRRRKKINILKVGKVGSHVFIIGQFKDNETSKYMTRLIDKAASNIDGTRFYYAERKDVTNSGFRYNKNPTIVFVKNGVSIKQYDGMIKDIALKIKEFSTTGKIETNTKQINNIENVKVFELDPDPNFSVAYNNLLLTLQADQKNISNISTFTDVDRNKLIVTVNYS